MREKETYFASFTLIFNLKPSPISLHRTHINTHYLPQREREREKKISHHSTYIPPITLTNSTYIPLLTLTHFPPQDIKLDIQGLTVPPEEHVHLTQYELHGLKAIVMYLHALPTSKKCVPELITDPIALIRDVRTVVEQHRYDKSELAKTCKPVLEWWTRVSFF